MADEPRHHLVYQNALVRVLDIVVPPGDTSRYHVHANPLIAITVQDARSWTQTLGAAPNPPTPAGPVPDEGDNWDQALPYTHRVANVDSVPYHRVAAEWLAPAGRDCPALSTMPSFRLLKEAPFGRVYEVRLAPHEATLPHRHVCPGLTVIGSGDGVTSTGSAPAATGGTGAGQWYWRDAGHDHVVRNTGVASAVVYEIDWR